MYYSKIILLLLCNILHVRKGDFHSNNMSIDFEGVRKLENDLNTLLIDVREPSELKEFGTIPGSINIPLAELESVLKDTSAADFKTKYGRDKPSKDFPIVFSCRSGRRSGIAQELAIKLGYSNVRNYNGSWLDWEKNIKSLKQ